MKFFNKKDTQKKVTTKLPMTGKVRTGFRRYCVAVLALTCYIATKIADVIKPEGTLGIIVSNSWLGTNAGIKLMDLLFFHIRL